MNTNCVYVCIQTFISKFVLLRHECYSKNITIQRHSKLHNTEFDKIRSRVEKNIFFFKHYDNTATLRPGQDVLLTQ